MRINERNEQIYEEWMAGASQRSLSKKYNLALTGISMIIKNVRYRKENPDHIRVYLEKHYTDVSNNLISGAIGPVLEQRHSYRCPISRTEIPRATIDYFFSILDPMTDKDILNLRCVGPKKLEFLKRIKADRAAGII